MAIETITDITIENNDEAPLINAAVVSARSDRFFYLIFKRFFDLVFSLLVSLIIILPVCVICLIIMVKDPGLPIYIHKRIGKDGKQIKVAKLRSMKKGADRLVNMLTPEQLAKYKMEFKLDDDPRLIGYKEDGDSKSCFGATIRRLSLDELPQIIWNICIMGNMSVVGPRPVLKEELEKHYTEEEQREFVSVKPGLTGYWQAYARNNATYESGERQRMELYYIRNRSFWLDLKIVFDTMGAVIRKRGAK